jgi:hypothetical protein
MYGGGVPLPRGRSLLMMMALPNVVKKARQQLGELTGLDVCSTVSARKDESGWCVQVEVVEKKSLPDSQDILATYELALDEEGNLLNFTRIGMRRRMDVAASAVAESGA